MSTPENPPPTGGDEPGRGMSGVQRASIVLGALAVLLIVFVVLRGGDDSGSDSSSSSSTSSAQSTAAQSTSTAQSSQSTSTDDSGSETGSTSDDSTSTSTATSTSTPTVPASQTVNVVNGQPQGGIKTISFKKGDQAVLKVNSDTADEIHVHGYDLKKDVEKGGSVTFTFKATIDGRFEVELENAGTQIANLEVQP